MSKSILVVDDNDPIRTLTRKYIEAQPGFKVCGEASDGIEAVEKAIDLSPDLIVMDFSMPRMNGLLATREIKQVLPGVPIILYTAYENAVLVSDANAAGISAIVSKSGDQKVLRTQILNLLDLG